MRSGRVVPLVLVVLAAWFVTASDAAGIERLYILNCGEGVAGDISRWSPGVDEGKSMDRSCSPATSSTFSRTGSTGAFRR